MPKPKKRNDDSYNPRPAKPLEVLPAKPESLAELVHLIDDSQARNDLRDFFGRFRLSSVTDFNGIARAYERVVLLSYHSVKSPHKAIELMIKGLNGFVAAKEKYMHLEFPAQVQQQFEARFAALMEALETICSPEQYEELTRLLDAGRKTKTE